MSMLTQHLIVLSLCLAAALWVARQVLLTFRTGKGGLGSCCAKGCGSALPRSEVKPQTAQVVFIPVENLLRRR